LALSSDTKISISMQFLGQVAAVLFMLGGGWWMLNAYAQKVEAIEQQKLPELETKVRLAADAIIRIQSDLSYIKQSQSELKIEQRDFKAEFRKEQMEQRNILNSVLTEVRK